MKTLRKRRYAFAVIIAMLLCMIAPVETVFAATGKTTLAVSSGTVNIGDTVTVTAKAFSESGGNAYATMTLNYDASILQFVECSTTYGGGNGSVSVSIDTFTVKLKAIAAGTSGISLTATDGVDFNSGEELVSMEGSSTTVTVNNAASDDGNTPDEGNTPSEGDTPGEGDTPSEGDTPNEGGETSNNNENNDEETPVRLSADNSLKTLTISPGTLSPAFKGSTVNYTATVSHDVTSVAVNAVVSNKNATVESVTGNTNLQVGENAIKIVVKAENGTTATYTIKVTKKAQEEVNEPVENETPEIPQTPETEGDIPSDETQTVSFNNGLYHVATVSESVIPEDFVRGAVNYHGTEYEGLHFEKGSLSLLYLVKSDSTDSNGYLVIYDETRDVCYPFTKLTNKEHYVIPLMVPVDIEIPESYTNTSFSIDSGESVSAYQILSENEMQKDFYLFYGVNQDGSEGWYQYDSMESTYQRCLSPFTEESNLAADENLENSSDESKEDYPNKNIFSDTLIYILIFAAAVLVIVFINIALYRRKKTYDEIDSLESAEEDHENKNEDEEDDDFFSFDREEEKDEFVAAPAKPVKKKERKEKKAEHKDVLVKKDVEVFDFNDED